MTSLANVVIDSLVEHPEEWTFKSCTIKHRSGVEIWTANSWTSRGLHSASGIADLDKYNFEFSPEEKQTIDRLVIEIRESRQNNAQVEERIKKALTDKPWFSETTKGLLLVLLFSFFCTLAGVMIGVSIGAAVTKAQIEAEASND